MKEYVINELNLSPSEANSFDCEAVKGVDDQKPRWENLEVLANQAYDKHTACKQPEEGDIYHKTYVSCDVRAAENIKEIVLNDEKILGRVTDNTIADWYQLFCSVAEYYANGECVPADGNKAIDYYRFAIKYFCYSVGDEELGDTTYAYIGDIYYFGKGIEADYDKALDFYKIACDDLRLGDYYYEGKALPTDYVKALSYYKSYDTSYNNATYNPKFYIGIFQKIAICYLGMRQLDEYFKYYDYVYKLWKIWIKVR